MSSCEYLRGKNVDNVSGTAVAVNSNVSVNMEDGNVLFNKWTSVNEDLKISSECNTEQMQPFSEENGRHSSNDCNQGIHETLQDISNIESDDIDVIDLHQKSCVNTDAENVSVTNFLEKSETISEDSDSQFPDYRREENKNSGIDFNSKHLNVHQWNCCTVYQRSRNNDSFSADRTFQAPVTGNEVDTEERKYLHNRSLVPLKRCQKNSFVFTSVNMNPCPRQWTRRTGINLFFPLSIRSLSSYQRSSTLILLSSSSNSYDHLFTQVSSQRLRLLEYYYDYIDESYRENGVNVSRTTIKLQQNSLPSSVIPPLTSDLYRYRFHSDTLALEQQKYSEVGKLLRTLSMDFEKKISLKVS